MHDASSFITLTYDDAHLPKNASLVVEDCQLFLKRLRKSLEPKRVRFFLCGEYGEKMGRPHYHAIIFGEDFSDKVPLAKRGDYTRWTSEKLTELWGKGRTEVGEVSFDSAVYVANYATKKITGAKADEYYQGRKPEFLLMSRKPGIGRPWLDRFCGDVFPRDEVIVNGKEARPPRYYGQVFEVLHPVEMEAVKARREAASAQLEEMVLADGNKVFVAPSRNARRLEVREKVARAKLALKRRNLENNT